MINYDFPSGKGTGGVEDYVHRIGRTARAGATGSAYTFLNHSDMGNSSMLRELVGVLTRCEQEVPPELEVRVYNSEKSVDATLKVLKLDDWCVGRKYPRRQLSFLYEDKSKYKYDSIHANFIPHPHSHFTGRAALFFAQETAARAEPLQHWRRRRRWWW